MKIFTWYGFCDKCGKVYTCPDGKMCCDNLTTLCKDAKGTRYAETVKPIKGTFNDPIYDLFSDIDKEQKENFYFNAWKSEQKH
jgi:hypothetical protein